MRGLVNQGKPEQSKTVTPTAAGFTVTPDGGKTLSSVVINGDLDLVSGNVRAGVNIFGETGTYSGDPVSGQTEILARCDEALTKNDAVYINVIGSQLSAPGTLPADVIRDIKFSFDNTYLACIAGEAGSPYLYVYKRNGDVFTKLANPSPAHPRGGSALSFSPDGIYLAVGQSSSVMVDVYKRSGDSFTRVFESAETSASPQMEFSPDGIHLAVGHYTSSPFIRIYKRNGDTFTLLSNPASLPGSSTGGVAYSPDGVHLVVTIVNSSSPQLIIYKRNGDAYTKLADPSNLPTASLGKAAFSPDGVYLAIVTTTTGIILFKRNGDTFTRLTDPANLPGTAQTIRFSPDGNYLLVTHTTEPYLTVYKRNGDSFTKIPDPAIAFPGNARGIDICSSGAYLAVGFEVSPYLAIYKYQVAHKSYNLITEANNANILGHMKEDGATGQIKQVIKLWG